ncbi:hypothetical protein SMMN14_06355, partial [Sphaerulina musiva]
MRSLSELLRCRERPKTARDCKALASVLTSWWDELEVAGQRAVKLSELFEAHGLGLKQAEEQQRMDAVAWRGYWSKGGGGGGIEPHHSTLPLSLQYIASATQSDGPDGYGHHNRTCEREQQQQTTPHYLRSIPNQKHPPVTRPAFSQCWASKEVVPTYSI